MEAPLHPSSVLLIKTDRIFNEVSALVRHAIPGGSRALGFSRTARRAGLCELGPGEAAVAVLAAAGGAAGETPAPRGTSHIDGRCLPPCPKGLWRALGGHGLGASAWPGGSSNKGPGDVARVTVKGLVCLGRESVELKRLGLCLHPHSLLLA